MDNNTYLSKVTLNITIFFAREEVKLTLVEAKWNAEMESDRRSETKIWEEEKQDGKS